MSASFPPVKIGIVVADVDMTIIRDGHSALTGENLSALVQTLQRNIPVLLISGSPYDSLYLGVATSGSLHRRVVTPLRQALEQQNAIPCLHFLKIFYASGRGVVEFDANGNEVRVPDHTDKDLEPSLRPLIFRAFLGGFYAIKTHLEETDIHAAGLENIWAAIGSDEEVAASTRQWILEAVHTDVGLLEKWSFGSELALVFHQTTAPGPSIATWAQRILREHNVALPSDIFWAGGTDFAKASRIRKRDIIEKAVEKWSQHGALSDGKIVLSFGDSNVDDFLNLYPEPHVSIFSGSTTDAVNFPSAWLTLDQQGRSQQQANAFGLFLKSFINNQWPEDSRFSLARTSIQI